MYVTNVEKPSLIPITYKDMIEFKLERNFLHVNNVKIFSFYTSYLVTGSTMEKSPSRVSIVGKP